MKGKITMQLWQGCCQDSHRPQGGSPSTSFSKWCRNISMLQTITTKTTPQVTHSSKTVYSPDWLVQTENKTLHTHPVMKTKSSEHHTTSLNTWSKLFKKCHVSNLQGHHSSAISAMPTHTHQQLRSCFAQAYNLQPGLYNMHGSAQASTSMYVVCQVPTHGQSTDTCQQESSHDAASTAAISRSSQSIGKTFTS